MCRWMAYLGDPVLAEELVFRPVHSIIDQSLHANLTGVTTNGGGFGRADTGRRSRPSTRAPILPGTTKTCVRSPATSAPRCCSRTSGRQRVAGPAQQLPPLPARPLVMDAQRVTRQFR